MVQQLQVVIILLTEIVLPLNCTRQEVGEEKKKKKKKSHFDCFLAYC